MTAPLPMPLDYPFAAPPAPGEAIVVAPGVLWLRMPLPFALDHINLWVLVGERADTLVDCGFGDAATRGLWERHFATTLSGRKVARVIATHCHPDHVGNAAWLGARFACPVAMTHAEYLSAHAMADQHSGYALEATLQLFRQHGMAPEHLAALGGRGNHYRRGVPELPQHFARLLDGDVLAAGSSRWRIVEGHGHSPEHASLHSEELAVLISGDMLLPRISTNVSVWAPEPGGDPLGRFLDSLSAFEALPADTLVLPSHGMPFRGISIRTAQLRAHHAARLDELSAAVAAAPPGGLTASEAIPTLFRRELDLQQRFFAIGEAIAHLNHLWHAGRLERRVDAGGTFRFAPTARGSQCVPPTHPLPGAHHVEEPSP
jgi:glyoxylase-like metal-dependent hydrolase (beta-lactamase superfamily II)